MMDRNHDVQPPDHPLLPKEAHRIAFRSRHALPLEHSDDDTTAISWNEWCKKCNMFYILWYATSPKSDLFLTAILVYVKPSHRCTRFIRWAVLQAIICLVWIYYVIRTSDNDGINNCGDDSVGADREGRDDITCLNDATDKDSL